MEFFAAGEVRHAARQAAAAADADDFFAAARGRFCGPLRAANPAAAARRLPGAGGPLHLHGVRARCRARLLAALAAQPLQLRAGSGHYFLFPRAAGCGGEPHRGRAAEAEILRSGHGPGDFARPRGKLPDFSGTHSEQLRSDGRNRPFRADGWHRAGEQAAEADAADRRRSESTSRSSRPRRNEARTKKIAEPAASSNGGPGQAVKDQRARAKERQERARPRRLRGFTELRCRE